MDVSLFVLLAYFCDVFVLNNYKNLKNLSESVAFFFPTVLGIKSQQWVRMSGLFPVLGGQMLFLQENISTVQA